MRDPETATIGRILLASTSGTRPAIDHGMLIGGYEAPHQILREDIDILLEGGDVRPAGLLRQPAPQGLQRPDVSDPGLMLHDVVDLGDHLQGLRRIKRRSGRKLDHDVDRARSRQFGIELACRGDRLTAIRHLVGETVARLELRICRREHRHDDKADQAVDARVTDHAARDPAAGVAENLDGAVGASGVGRKLGLVPDQQDPEQRHQRQHGHERDEGCDQPRLTEGPDQIGLRKLQGDE